METACEKPKNSITGSLIDSGLFDSKWYLERYSWVEKERNIPIIHYVESGEVNNRLPNEYFHPTWYRKKYLADMHGVTNCLLHYFQIGRFKGFAPSPYFDTEAYAAAIGSDLRPENALEYWLAGDRQVAPPANDKLVLEVEIEKTGLFLAHWYKKQYLQNDHDTISPIEHYCTIGAVEGHKPNPYFDPIWYLAANPHVAESGEDPLIHYAMHGWRNGKIPSHRFDAQKYLAENTMLNSANSVEYEPLNHYLYCTDKNNDGQDMVSISEFTGYIDKPSVGCNEIFRDFLSEPGFRLIRYYAGSVALEKEVRKKFSLELELILKKSELHWLRQLESLELLAAMYHPVTDSGLYSEAVLIDFLLFLRNFDNDISIPTGIYDPNIYREITGSTSSDAACLKEWILSSDKIIPNRYFDVEIYKKSSGVNLNDSFPLFLQWVYGGMYENICNGNLIALNYIKSRLNCEEGANIFASYLVARGVAFSRRYETLEKDRKEHLGAQIISEYFRYHSDLDLWDRLKCGQLSKQIFAAAEYDSKILERGLDIGISRPPFNTVLASIVRRVRIELPRKKYDTVILIPHCRMSGATKIAGKFADALVTLGIDESILIVITDLDINIHPEWFPHGVDVFSLANVNSGLEKTQKESALYDLLIGVRPRRVVNFNSALGWDVFEIYGKRLATQQSLSAYLFCYDLNKDEVKVGYPSRYFVSSLSYLDKVMFDSDYLREEVTTKNLITCEEDLRKLKTLYTPVETDLSVQVIGRSDAQFQNNVVYWGGRLDRQKNFNLVLRIAELLPEIQFHCWGESVIGDYQLEEAPVNVTINPPFNDIDELDFEKCDLWLYTSKWDGIPNLILEVGVREIPLVSTAVWGTEDILNKSNSWIVEDIDNEKVYCAEILSALSSAKERTVRAAVLKQDIITRHSKEKFSESIRRFFYQDLTHD